MAKKLEPTQLIKEVGYFNHDYVRRGLNHLEELEAMTIKAVAEVVDMTDADEIDFAFALKAIAEQRASLHGMNVAHSRASRLIQKIGFRKVDGVKDWVNPDGTPKGFGRR